MTNFQLISVISFIWTIFFVVNSLILTLTSYALCTIRVATFSSFIHYASLSQNLAISLVEHPRVRPKFEFLKSYVPTLAVFHRLVIKTGKSKWCTTNKIPVNVDAREETTADEILSRCSNDMLKPMLTRTNNKGNNGAPSHPVTSKNCQVITSASKFAIAT